MIMMKMSLSA
ncbi:hypothetical protein LINPERPRIM_LOCUS8731 [Linum perenne]